MPTDPKNVTVRTVETELGEITYTFERKPVRNINLRVRAEGVFASANRRVAASRVDDFVRRRASYIISAQERFRVLTDRDNPADSMTDEECMRVLAEVIAEVYPVFERMGIAVPQVYMRRMVSQWGSCSPRTGRIGLNRSLAGKPRDCIEYVVYHEFCHFIHPNHSRDFWTLLESVLPDWKERRKRLND